MFQDKLGIGVIDQADQELGMNYIVLALMLRRERLEDIMLCEIDVLGPPRLRWELRWRDVEAVQLNGLRYCFSGL